MDFEHFCANDFVSTVYKITEWKCEMCAELKIPLEKNTLCSSLCSGIWKMSSHGT